MVIQEIMRLLVAAALGAIIGFERERGDRAAGLRTHALVCTASALVMLVSAYGFTDMASVYHGAMRLDPSRMAAQVVSGVGFLGAGTIILRKNAVRGLTTAASIWMVAGIGLACGTGQFIPAGATTGIALAILSGLKPLEQRFFDHKRFTLMTIQVRRQAGQVAAIEDRVRTCGVELLRLRLEPVRTHSASTITLEMRGGRVNDMSTLAEHLRDVPGVKAVSYGKRDIVVQDDESGENGESDEELA